MSVSVLLSNLRPSVSDDLLCAFELLKPLDGPALRKEMTKAKRKRFVAFVSVYKHMFTPAVVAVYTCPARLVHSEDRVGFPVGLVVNAG